MAAIKLLRKIQSIVIICCKITLSNLLIFVQYNTQVCLKYFDNINTLP